MASVSSLDKDMRNIRLSRYTPQAANEVRLWIEDVLGERLATGDLLEALKDGVALCKYAARLPGGLNLWNVQADARSQACQSCSPAGCTFQSVLDAIRPDGEHFPFSTRMSIASIEPTIPRHLPDGRSLRIERPRSGIAVHFILQ